MNLLRKSKPAGRRRPASGLLTILPAALMLAAPGVGLAAGLSGYKVQMPAAAKAGQLTPFQPCTFKGLSARGTDAAQCATLVVAENPKKPNGRLIALPVVKLPALKAEKPEALVYLQGGPGVPNLSYHVNARGVFENNDVYMVGYRGVADPDPLRCPEFEKAMVTPHPASEEAAPQITDAVRRCAERITASGIDLSQYTMVNVVEDHEAARKALGIAKFNLISESYGTRVAQFYTRLHPKSVRSSILISVNPPGHFRWNPEATDEIIREYAKLCAADAACSARTSDLTKAVFETLARNDLTFEGKPIDMDKVRFGAFFMLMEKANAVMAFDAILVAEKGDTSGLARLTTLYDGSLPRMLVWGDSFSKAGFEHRPAGDVGAYRQARLTTPTSFGSPVDLFYLAAAKGWPTQPPPKGFDKPAVDKTPTLLINTNLDATTPTRYVRDELLPYLPNGRLVVLSNLAHEDWGKEQAPALDRLLSGFLKDGTVDASGYVTSPVKFH